MWTSSPAGVSERQALPELRTLRPRTWCRCCAVLCVVRCGAVRCGSVRYGHWGPGVLMGEGEGEVGGGQEAQLCFGALPSGSPSPKPQATAGTEAGHMPSIGPGPTRDGTRRRPHWQEVGSLLSRNTTHSPSVSRAEAPVPSALLRVAAPAAYWRGARSCVWRVGAGALRGAAAAAAQAHVLLRRAHTAHRGGWVRVFVWVGG